MAKNVMRVTHQQTDKELIKELVVQLESAMMVAKWENWNEGKELLPWFHKSILLIEKAKGVLNDKR